MRVFNEILVSVLPNVWTPLNFTSHFIDQSQAVEIQHHSENDEY